MTMSKLKKTLLFGGLVGAGLVWLTSTKKGKETRDKMFDAAADIYVDVTKKMKTLEAKYQTNKTMYEKTVRETVEAYAKKHPVIGMAKDMIIKMVVSQFENMKEDVTTKVKETKTAAKGALKKKAKK
jgi:hypothetical protein